MEKHPVRICAAADVPEGSGKAFIVGGRRIAVFFSQGKYYASSDTCTHEEESLSDGWLEGDRIECPRHGAQFCLRSGQVLSSPATEPIEVYDVELRDGDLYVSLPVEHSK